MASGLASLEQNTSDEFVEAELIEPRSGSEPIPFNAPSVVGEEFYHIADAIHRGQLSGDGHYTHLCEVWLQEKTGAAKALLTHSCTAALEMAAILCDLQPGDEVIMPSFTFVSTANAVVMRGAVPVFVDIEENSLNICPQKTREAITDKTKAIFVVHYAGVIADMPAFKAIADEHNLFLVEDAAQALGSTLNGQQAGSFGDLATFSFHETKNVISGEGGALLVNNPDMQDRAEIIREKGTNRSQFFRGQVDKYTWVEIGSSYLPGELIAAFLYGQLSREAEIYQQRLAIWKEYDRALTPLVTPLEIKTPHSTTGHGHNGHMYYLLMPTLDMRQAFIKSMKQQNITTPFHYIPLHSSPAGERLGRANGSMDVTNLVSDTLVRLPVFYSLKDQSSVIDAIKWALDSSAAN